MTSKLSGKIALVTGGSAGIGLGIAKRFAEEGARVFITGRRQSELDKAVTAIGGGATAVQGDISNLDDLDRIYATIKDKAGRIDVLAVNAGYYEFGSFGEITEQMGLTRHGAHTFWGLLTRTAATIAAHTLIRVCLAAA